ncbi:Syntaxin [Yasminevirus sp. GU-2018]|uniref:Syntaxin n=1 Tax=Yasminevirus sp. GU-2018 TaxID=2420051 RepID=A0A5K0UBS4_9VIRU|nr:Syntaxin [Yasminevirus sp. GU-2018]
MSFKKSPYRKLDEPDERSDSSIAIPMQNLSDQNTDLERDGNQEDYVVTREQLLRAAEEQFQQQDEMLNQLGETVTNIKQVAITIGTELEKQDEVIKDISEHVDDTNSGLTRANRRITLLSRARDNCGFLGCILFLVFVFIAIILILLYGGVFKDNN